MPVIVDTVTSAQTARAVAAAQAQATALGIAVNIAVIDAGTHLKGFVRMDGAVLGSIDVAMTKARTAVLFAVSSAAVWDYCKPGAPASNLEASNGGLMPFPGGLPLIVDDVLVGAVGVSGAAPSQDLEIAQAAVAAIND